MHIAIYTFYYAIRRLINIHYAEKRGLHIAHIGGVDYARHINIKLVNSSLNVRRIFSKAPITPYPDM